jgi:hypothetical protein
LDGEVCDPSTGICTGLPSESCRQCACVANLSIGGCGDVCDMAKNGMPTTPNFCNGVAALPQCAMCLAEHCSGFADPPDPSNPAACM